MAAEGRNDAPRVVCEVYDHEQPSAGSDALAPEAFAARSRVMLAVVRPSDCGQDPSPVRRHLRMLGHDVPPTVRVEHDAAIIGVAVLAD
ncbi:MAG: hypothetical protein ACR2LK_01160 [Solirubrobacteraceae bacterium]